MRRFLLLVPLLAFVTACQRSPVYDGSRFHDAQLLDDGQTGLVSFMRGRYRLVDRWLMGGGVPAYVEDVKLLARVDVSTGAVDVLLRDESPRGGNGTGNWTIRDTCGRIALVYRELRTSYSGPEVPSAYALLDLDTGALRVLDPARELAPARAELRHGPRLLDDRGVLLYETYRAGTERPSVNQPLDLFLRQPNGAIDELGRGKYQLHGNGKLCVWFPGERERTEIDLISGTNRHMTNREYADASSGLRAREHVDLCVTTDQQGLELAKQESGAWVRSRVPVDVEALR